MRTLPKVALIAIFCAVCAGSLPLAAQYDEDEWIPKVRFELAGSYLSSVFGDMFLIAGGDEGRQTFFYDDRLTWMYTNGNIQYWSVAGFDDGFPSMKRTFPIDIRARFQSPWYMVSFGIGFRTFSSSVDKSLPIEYIRAVNENEGYSETLSYDYYRMKVNGFAFPITGYYNMTEGRGVDAGLYLGFGPFFANAVYEKSWSEGFESIINGERVQNAPTVSHTVQMEGKGVGIVFEAGTRLDFNISRRFALFAEAGYVYHALFSLSGAGRELNGTTVETWNGKWMLRTKTLTAEWNTEGNDIQYLDSRPAAGSDILAEEAFSLNISGGTIRLGFSLRF